MSEINGRGHAARLCDRITKKGNKMKEQRFYTRQDDIYLVHDQPYYSKSIFVSIVNDLTFYRHNFKLEKAWG